MTIILFTALVAMLLAFVLGSGLGFFQQVFAVKEDPLVGQIREALPGANCGACGFPGCDGLSAAIARGEAPANACPVGGQAAATKIAALVGGGGNLLAPSVAVVACQGIAGKAKIKGEYTGIKDCRGAKISTGSVKLCSWGCQGFGDCVNVCKFGAITMGEDGIPHVDASKCTGCKACANECPQRIIQMIPKDQKGAITLCSNRNVLKPMVAKSCKMGCIKCELCVKNCSENCIKMVNGIPVVDYAKCTSCGTCVEKCPTKAMTL